jgi:hypothetical protein
MEPGLWPDLWGRVCSRGGSTGRHLPCSEWDGQYRGPEEELPPSSFSQRPLERRNLQGGKALSQHPEPTNAGKQFRPRQSSAHMVCLCSKVATKRGDHHSIRKEAITAMCRVTQEV